MTNYEKVKENLTVEKMAFLMFNVPRFCPFKYGCDECIYYEDSKTNDLCFGNPEWTEQNYKEWLESEAD